MPDKMPLKIFICWQRFTTFWTEKAIQLKLKKWIIVQDDNLQNSLTLSSECVRIWTFSLCNLRKLFSHTGHWWGFIPLWRRKWSISSSPTTNSLLQIAHWWVAFSIWFLEWRKMSENVGNTSWHNLHSYSCSSIDLFLWVLRWAERDSGDFEERPQMMQMKSCCGRFILDRSTSSECRMSCRTSDADDGNRFWHLELKIKNLSYSLKN